MSRVGRRQHRVNQISGSHTYGSNQKVPSKSGIALRDKHKDQKSRLCLTVNDDVHGACLGRSRRVLLMTRESRRRNRILKHRPVSDLPIRKVNAWYLLSIPALSKHRVSSPLARISTIMRARKLTCIHTGPA
jgi:hypothetical protein